MSAGFDSVIGHRDVIRHLLSAIENDRVSHAYLISGDAGSGKRMIADAFAMALLCRDTSRPEPCLICPSCKKAADHNHPDILYVTHEKPNVISVGEIRQQLVNTAWIRPNESRRKVYIVADAEKMNPQAQNALLKTIEEPPEYVVILLLCASPESLLPTIHSRCVELPLLPVPDRDVEEYLRSEVHVPDYEAKVICAFAQGNVGRAVKAARDPSFTDKRDRTIRLIRDLSGMDTAAVTAAVKSLKEEKDQISEILDIMRMYFRDVLLYKTSAETDQLIFTGELPQIQSEARGSSYEGLEKILRACDTCQDRLRANVNFDLSLELLLLGLRENCRPSD